MHTNRLFRENVYLRECDASIRSVSTREDKVLITLDQTIFFPTGGGQSCDLGTINDFAVVDVYEYEDDIFHCVACAPDALRVGDSVHLTLDWARRFAAIKWTKKSGISGYEVQYSTIHPCFFLLNHLVPLQLVYPKKYKKSI